jgi:glycosyltransferase involved in cell wall biosynthesis
MQKRIEDNPVRRSGTYGEIENSMLSDEVWNIIEAADEVPEYPHAANSEVLVSALVQTYNDCTTIRKCIEGILKQETTFNFEILIGEDESQDSTRQICIELAEQHPSKIRLFLHSRKNNITIGGKPTGKFNFIHNISKIRGKYFTICEGDDYWTDPRKLQKQVDVLEQNPKATLCYHRVQLMRSDMSIESDEQSVTERRFRSFIKQAGDEINITHLLTYGNFVHTCSMMGRSNALRIEEPFLHSPVGDFLIYALLTQNGGKILKIDEEPMAIYRVGTGTFTSQDDTEILLDIIRYESCLLALLQHEGHRRLFLNNRVRNHHDDLKKKIVRLSNRELPMREILNQLTSKIQRKLGQSG